MSIDRRENPAAEAQRAGLEQGQADALACNTTDATKPEANAAPSARKPAIEWKPWPGPHPRLGRKHVLQMRRELPYGVWTCADGTRVLFNRDYQPIWKRTSDGVVTRVDIPPSGMNWVNWDTQDHFFNDGNPPWYCKETLRRLKRVLAEFGVRQGGAS
jgi:hypothetical protein